MDSFIFDFLRGKFNLHKEIKNKIVENNKNKNENQINVESKNTVKNNEIKKETDCKEKKMNGNKGTLISASDYLTDEEFNSRFGTNNQMKDQNEGQHVSTKENEEKIKTKTMKLECIADLYNIDKEIVEKIINLDTGNLYNAKKVLVNLQTILDGNKDQTREFKNRIKRCYIGQFLLGKTFTKMTLRDEKSYKDRFPEYFKAKKNSNRTTTFSFIS